MKLTIPEIKQFVKELLTESDVRYLMEQEQKSFDPEKFKRAVMASRPDDKFKILLLKTVQKGPVTVFKEGKEYEGTVLPSETEGGTMEWVEVKHEPVVFVGKKTKMLKRDFVKEVIKQGAPCETIDCDKSKFIREGVGTKTFTEFLNNPTFEKAETEEETEEAAAPTEEKCQSGRAPGWQCKEMGYPHPEDPAEKAAGDQTEAELAKKREGWELGIPPGHKRYKRADFGEFKTPMHRWTPPTLPGMEGGGAAAGDEVTSVGGLPSGVDSAIAPPTFRGKAATPGQLRAMEPPPTTAPQSATTTAQPPVKSHRVTGGQGYYQILRDLDLLKGLKRPQRRALMQKLKSAFGGRMITTKDVVHVDANGNFRVEGHGRQLEENKSFSSFPEYQNFFEGWNKYLTKE
jgi:hypothetical protein